tara:strand:+ start:94 stop:531 length:438 start_codon:yes stop_codon:yes gene_type:complete
MSSQEYQQIVDEYKECIPDGLYKKLCDLNMKKNKDEVEDEAFYTIYYFIPKHHYRDDDDDNVITIDNKTVIKKLTNDQYNLIKTEIETNNYCKKSLYTGDEYGFFDILDREHIIIKNIECNEEDDSTNSLSSLDLDPLIYKIERA